MIFKKYLNELISGKCDSILVQITRPGKLKLNKSSHPKIFFNNAPVFCANWQKYLGKSLDETLNFNLYIKEKMSKAMKGIGIIKKLSKTLF